MKRITFARLALLVGALAVLLTLQGCGGDDNGDISQSMHDQVVMERDNLQDMLDAANAKVMELEAQAGTDGELAAAKADAAKYKKMIDDMAAEEAREAASKGAEALRGLILNDVTLLDHAPPSGDAAGTMPSDIDIMASSAMEFTAEADDYDQAAGMPDPITGFRGAMLNNADDRQTIVVYSDIEDADATPLFDEYSNVRPPNEPRQYYVDREETGDMTMAGDIPWSQVTRPNSVFTETPGVDETDDDDDVNAMTSFVGMVRGVPGTFSCENTPDASCVRPTELEDGKYSAATVTMSGQEWLFTPDSAAATVDVPDGDGHLVFGWWLQKDADGVPTGVDVFATAMGMDGARTDTATTVMALEGSATYSGGAAGKYALHSLGGANSEAGHWTASASLTADFDVDNQNQDPDQGFTLSGTVDDFMTGETARDWTVTLMTPDQNTDAGAGGMQGLDSFAASGPNSLGGTSLTTEWDIGGAVKGIGNWRAQVWGGDTDDHPMAVTGEFDASLGTVGSILGAFGATMDMDDDS